ncbi:MAG: UDP-N-acetyl-D-glucosamine dehydrogenase [Chloroflexota bacterium]|jgi:UDP-N-acetyl-D-glucosamine dehydrogenase|nr:UDP-N-acetyl-D-glucosamine dehydrogenase [Chloroflexota bacterium]
MKEDSVADRMVAVIGLGYVGLPLALDLAEAGHQVLGIDASTGRVNQLRAGGSYIDDVASGRVAAAVANGTFRPESTDTDWTDAPVAFICVPTPVTASREPDLGPILAAGEYVRRGLRAGDLVVLQSTTYPGTTMGPLRSLLERDGLRAGRDFGLAFSPERVSPGEGRPSSSIPRLVGGIDEGSTTRAAALLRPIAPSVTEMSSPDAAELAKLFENVFRNVNIALVNELALICERLGLDVWEVIRGASTKPFGFMPFYPGPGVGGHCIPVDPYYLAARAREVGFHERFIETAGDINSRMPEHVISLVAAALNARGKAVRGSSVFVIGVAFKPGVSDDRNSPAAPIIAGLQSAGAIVSYHDPRLAAFDPAASHEFPGLAGEALRSVPLGEALAAAPDCVVIVTPHPEIDWDAVFDGADMIVDTRDASRGRSLRAGQVLRLGAGWS